MLSPSAEPGVKVKTVSPDVQAKAPPAVGVMENAPSVAVVFMASEKVIAIVVVVATAVLPSRGLIVVIVGAVMSATLPVVKPNEKGDCNAVLVLSWAPVPIVPV